MLKLIKNEMYKILKKSSTHIVFLISVLFIILVSIILKTTDNFAYENNTYVSVDSTDEVANMINNELKELNEEYKNKEWQSYVINNNMEVIMNYYEAKYNNYDNFLEYEKEYNDFHENLKSDNWKYFVNKDIKKDKELLKSNKEYLDMDMSLEDKKNLEAEIFSISTRIEVNEYRLKEGVVYGSDYLNDAISNVLNNSYAVKLYELGNKDTKEEYEYSVKEYYESRYILDTKEDTNNEQDLRSLIMHFFDSYYFLILVFGVMIAGSMVSDEYSKGTIKSILITPYKRSSILLSKFLTTLIMLILFTISLLLVQLLVGGLLFSFDSLKTNVTIYNLATNSLEVLSLFKYTLIKFIANMPRLVLLITLAFSLSTIIGNTAFATVIAFAGSIGASIVNMFYEIYKINILRYFVTTNWDFNEYLFGSVSRYNTSITHAIIVCIIYFLIMIITSFIVFNKKNIKNI